MQFVRLAAFMAFNMSILYAWLSAIDPKTRGLAVRLTMASVLSISQAIATIFALGLVGPHLTAANLFMVNGAIALALIFVTAIRKRRLPLRGQELKAASRMLKEAVSRSYLVKILAGLVALAFLALGLLGAIYPPVEWDSLMYHLPAAAFYQQNQSLLDPALPMLSGESWDPSIWINAFPKNIELLFLWTTLLAGTTAFTDLVPLAFALLGIAAVYVLAIKVGVDRHWAAAAGLLFFLTPIVLAQARSNYIDLSNSVLILAALALLWQRDHDDHTQTAVAGLAAGVILGAKWSGLLFVFWLVFFLIGQRTYLSKAANRPALAPLLRDSALFLAPALLMGGYWYAKSWYLYGNPLWPFQIAFAGVTVFPGTLSAMATLGMVAPEEIKGLTALGKVWMSWREPVAAYDYDAQLGGLGPFWFILALPSLYYTARWAVSERNTRLLLLFLAVAGMFLWHPDNWWSRFTIFIAAIGAIAFVIVRSAQEDQGTARLIDVLAAAVITYSTLAAFATSYYLPAKISSVLAVPSESRTSGLVRPEIISGAYEYISSVTAASPANIAFGAGLEFTYPLWGPEQANSVFYIEPRSYRQWVKELENKNVNYLVARTRSREHRLAKGRAPFTQAFVDSERGYVVYEFSGQKTR
jgi:hypothetical protein